MLRMEHERRVSRSAGNFFNTTTRRKQASEDESMQYPRFYKIVTPYMLPNALPNCKMVLPSTFVRTYLANIECPQTMVLRSFTSGCEWQITYMNQSFEEGWRVFSTDYNLGIGDVITFQLEGEFRFMVQVYSKSGCEKSTSFVVATGNMWTHQRHCATPAVKGVTQQDLESTKTRQKKLFLKKMNRDHLMPQELCELRSRSASACISGGSQDCIDKRALPSQTLNIRGKVNGKFSAAIIERHQKRRRIDSPLLVTSKSGVTMGADFGHSSNDIERPFAVGCRIKFNRDDQHVKGKQMPHFMRRQSPTSQTLAKGFIEKAKRTTNLQLQMKCRGSWLQYKRRLLKFANFLPRVTPQSTHEHAEQSADNVTRTTRKSSGEAQDSYSIEHVKTTRITRLSEEKRTLGISGQTLNPYPGGTSKRPDCDTSVETKPDEWKFVTVNAPNNSENQHQEVAGTPAKAGRGRPRKCLVNDQPATKPEVPTPGFRRVDRDTPAEDVQNPAKPKRGRPCIHYKRQAWIKSSMRQERILFVSQRRPVTQSEKDDAAAAAYSAAARMQSPCIVLILKPSAVYKNFALRFPAKFASQQMPRETKEVLVCDAEWNSWSCWWNPLYHHINGRGWRSFALEHCLEEDDACVFEILEHTRKNFTMMVHIFRVADITAGQTAWDSHICPHNCFPEDSSCPISPIERKLFVDSEFGPPSETPRKFTSTHDDDDDNDNAELRGVKTEINVDSGMTEAISTNPLQEKQKKGGQRNFGSSLDDDISDTETVGLSDQQLQNPKRRVANKKDYYTVGRLCNRIKVRKNNIFLVELEGVVPPMPHVESADCKPDGNGNWWVHERNFTSDFRYCHIP